MHILFVHGMGRSPLSAWPNLRHLRRHGHLTHTFGYVAALQSFPSICRRLRQRIMVLAAQGEYAVMGHSLGGVLLRAVLADLPAGTRLPSRLFLLASPVTTSCLAMRMRQRWLFRLGSGDCGQMLADAARMAAIPPSVVPCTAIIGIGGPQGRFSVFPGEPNDGVVSEREVSAAWQEEQIMLPLMHTLMPARRVVAELVLARLPLSS
ncbi:esterase/lipase family protein [Chitinimonas naiadis]